MANVTLRFRLTDHLPELSNVLESFQSVSVNEPEELVDVIVDDVVTGAVAGATEYMLSIGYTLDATDPASTLEEAARIELFSVDSLRESGGTDLAIGAVADGQHLVRSGTAFVGANLASPGGSDTEVQFNNGGAFAGISGITTDGTNLLVSGAIVGAGLGGQLDLTGADSATVAGGDVFVTGGNAGTVGGGGGVILKSGDAIGSGEDSGAITLDAGTTVDGNVGDILIARANGSVGIGVSFVTASAVLEIASTTHGFLMPRMTTTQRDAIGSPATGLEVYNLTTNEPEFFDGSIWRSTGGTAAGGSNSQLQFNSNGAFAGASGITTNGTNLSVGGNLTLTGRLDGITAGDLIIRASSNNPTGRGVIIQGGFADTTGGKVRLEGGSGGQTGGGIELIASEGTNGAGGSLLYVGGLGAANDGSGAGGSHTFTCGQGGFNSGDGGSFNVTTGLAEGSSAASGSITLDIGVSFGGGPQGNVFIAPSRGNVGIGGFTLDGSALLELTSTTRGFLMPRQTTTQRDSIASPATGLEIYNLTTNTPEFFDGSAWSSIGGETLAATLVAGNTTGGNNIVMSSGDTIVSPDGATGQSGGQLRLQSGAGDGAGNGGDLNVIGGNAGATGIGGEVSAIAGAGGSTSGPGGSVTLAGGNASGASDNGGFVILDGGNPGAGGVIGPVALQANSGGSVGIGTFAPSTLLELQGTDPVLTVRADGDLQVASLDLLGSRDANSSTFAQIRAYNFRSGAAVEAASIDFAPATIGTSSGVIAFNTKTEAGSLTERVRIDDVGHVGIGTPTPDISAILELASSTAGFLQTRVTTTERDAIPSTSTGLSVYNTVATAPEFFDGTQWVGYEASIATVYVRSAADLPVPAAGVITLADTTVYKFLNSVDVGTDRLVSGLDTGIVGIGSGIVTLSGTTAGALLSTNGTNPLCLVDLKLQQNGAGDLMNLTGEAFALNEFVNCRFGGGVTRLFTTGGMQIKGSLFIAAPIVLDSTASVDIIVASDSGFDDDGAVDGVFVFEGGCSLTNFFIRDVGIFLFSAGSTGIRVEGGATITNLVFGQSAMGAIDSGAIIFQVENPDDVLLGSISTTTLQGAGTFLRCEPVSSSNFAAPTNDTGTLAFDGVNLITARQQSGGINQIRLHTGVTSSIQTTITAPDAELRGVTWARGNLITVDGTTIPGPPTVSIHAGFTTTVSSTFTAPATSPQGITYDGTNLISTDNVTGLVYVHDGISATILKTFATPGGSVRDIAFDGVNLIITDSTNTVFVMKGISATVQYSFTGPGSLTDGITVTDVGAAIADDTLTGTIYVFDHSVTFDQSSATWEIINNTGARSSSDRGGSQYEDGNVSVTVVQNAWTDISDAGTAIFYAGFNGMEKCRLSDELNGEVTWTGVRERGSILQGQVVITRAGGGADEFYEVAVVINGEVQTDGKGSGVLPSASSFSTIGTLPITRDLVVGDVIKVQIRNVTSTQSPEVSVNRLSIT